MTAGLRLLHIIGLDSLDFARGFEGTGQRELKPPRVLEVLYDFICPLYNSLVSCDIQASPFSNIHYLN